MQKTKILLDENDIPKRWYNILPDMPTPLSPPLNPQTREPVEPKDLSPIFPIELIKQEVSQEKFIPIPDEVRDIYALWRPSPLYRAHRLEAELKTPARIYYKYEGVSPAGSHKPNTAIAQAYYNMKEGMERLTTETGAGQWGSALSLATSYFDLKCTVYMVKISYQQKPYRKSLMQLWGADVIPSPSNTTNAGKKILSSNPDSPGSLGIAISEAIEDAATHDNAHYSLGSVLNHVMLHQTVIGQEAKEQLAQDDEYPDYIIGCVGGGSNFSGISFPFIMDKLTGSKDVNVIAVEPTACLSLTRGEFRYDFGDTIGLTPLLKMYTMGHEYIPPAIHAGGLRYHGDSPIVSQLYADKVIDAVAYNQTEVFKAGVTFARTEGIVPAPESAHAIKCAIDKALECRKSDEKKTILFNLSGHGHFDMSAYDSYFSGNMTDIK
ncbi:pyridoxal-phosphate dependent TrpB-like enzyme [Candidatus Methanoperedens nitroreducens]|uniref:Tryptophan synthase beta chain n=1 Tax=Candidatus Methanoperedens nitratireducens TaxID=1392998 RepID=A0A062V8M4_9EURY|nr:TrpB-like pyridoxal phosphate-dependent enzyme [Candidatus Methanoperedens nitroreducens]KCZ72109.1 pyridoxal-phosphate dependent TrpB-like enzyme [Candidatus Methanoperedens nitroreducens]MDJ1421914.1 TrpB-like pyridoxal phosphate-dependent enzyme [Candidatus Methanoperedens sp.]